MPRWTGPKKPRPQVGEATDPQALTPLVNAFLEQLRIRNYSKWTVVNYENCLMFFLAWCEERGISRASDVTRPMILRYQRSVFHYLTPKGKPLGVRAQHKRVQSVMGLFKWLTRENHILYNPASEIELPKMVHRLPLHVLTAEEADLVINQPDVDEPLGIRNRAILEMFYSTGMRRSELMNLKIFDVDLERGMVMVRQGKGRKDRMIPVGERAIAWTQKYLIDVRPSLVVEPDEGILFLSYAGNPIARNQLSQLVKSYVEKSGIPKHGSCHLFRHAMATLMLEGGADIRYIQQMLGHSNLQTTEVYTHVSIRKLKEIHSATHPSAKMQRSLLPDDRYSIFSC